MKELEIKFLITSTVILTFAITAITGVLMYIDHKLKHSYLKSLHIYSGLLFVILAIIHFILNYRLYKNEARIFFRS